MLIQIGFAKRKWVFAVTPTQLIAMLFIQQENNTNLSGLHMKKSIKVMKYSDWRSSSPLFLYIRQFKAVGCFKTNACSQSHF